MILLNKSKLLFAIFYYFISSSGNELIESKPNPIVDFFKKVIINITALVCSSKYDSYYSDKNLSTNCEFLQGSNIIAFNPKNDVEVRYYIYIILNRFFVLIQMAHFTCLM